MTSCSCPSPILQQISPLVLRAGCEQWILCTIIDCNWSGLRSILGFFMGEFSWWVYPSLYNSEQYSVLSWAETLQRHCWDWKCSSKMKSSVIKIASCLALAVKIIVLARSLEVWTCSSLFTYSRRVRWGSPRVMRMSIMYIMSISMMYGCCCCGSCGIIRSGPFYAFF